MRCWRATRLHDQHSRPSPISVPSPGVLGSSTAGDIGLADGHARNTQDIMGLRTLIVDDEPIARQILREELEQFDAVEIAGEADDGASALAAVRELSPDLI